MTVPADPAQPTTVLTNGRRPTLALRLVFLLAVAVVSTVVLALAIAAPDGDGQGGSGNVVIPAAVAVFALLGLAFTAGQWWDDATHFRVVGGRLEARHGGRRLRGRPVAYETDRALVLVAEGARDAARLFLDQDGRRLDLGRAATLGSDQLRAWESWMRAQGMRVSRESA